KEKDKASKARLEEVNRELAEFRSKVEGMKAVWMREKELINKVRELKEKLDNARMELERATRGGQFDKAGEPQDGVIPELARQRAWARSVARSGRSSFLARRAWARPRRRERSRAFSSTTRRRWYVWT